MFKNRDVMLVFPIPIYPKISIQSPIPNYATSVSVKHILSTVSDVLSHHHMPPSSFSTLITAPAPILQSFLQLLPPPMKPQFQPGSTSVCLSQGPLSLSNLGHCTVHISLGPSASLWLKPARLKLQSRHFSFRKLPDLTSLQWWPRFWTLQFFTALLCSPPGKTVRS